MPVYLHDGQETREGLEAVGIVECAEEPVSNNVEDKDWHPVLTSDFHIYTVLLEGLQAYPLPSQIHNYPQVPEISKNLFTVLWDRRLAM